MNRANLQQALILALTGAATALIVLLPAPFPRWGCFLGLAAQPFWLHSTWYAVPRQWGIHVLAWVYVGIYAVGIAHS